MFIVKFLSKFYCKVVVCGFLRLLRLNTFQDVWDFMLDTFDFRVWFFEFRLVRLGLRVGWGGSVLLYLWGFLVLWFWGQVFGWLKWVVMGRVVFVQKTGRRGLSGVVRGFRGGLIGRKFCWEWGSSLKIEVWVKVSWVGGRYCFCRWGGFSEFYLFCVIFDKQCF